MRSLVVTYLLSALVGTASAATWHILPDGSGDAPTIQAGIDSASAGDTVLLGCGTYRESNITIDSSIVLRSETGQHDCAVIDAEGRGRVISILAKAAASLVGITLTRGHHDSGGGLYCESASPVITNCSFQMNYATAGYGVAGGGGLYCVASSPTLSDCRFSSNRATYGGGAYCDSLSAASFTRCAFEDNTSNAGGGVFVSLGSAPVLTNCRFNGNAAGYGGAVYSYSAAPRLVRCLLTNNIANERGGAIGAHSSSLTAERCTFVGNHSPWSAVFYAQVGSSLSLLQSLLAFNTGGPAASCDVLSNTVLECSDVFGNPGGDWVSCIAGQELARGNFSADPLFCDPESDDFTLQSRSPCLAPCGTVGASDVGCGPVQLDGMSWGRTKTLYRE